MSKFVDDLLMVAIKIRCEAMAELLKKEMEQNGIFADVTINVNGVDIELFKKKMEESNYEQGN